MNTVLPTGPGAWELRDKGITAPSRKAKTKSVLKAIPSPSHMSIVQLHRNGTLKYLVSQNTDGLHLRSGMDPDAMAELHGNTNLEICVKCGARYLRDFRTRSSRKVHDHFTGRFCEEVSCNGRLKDSIINFGEDLPQKDLSNAYLHAEKADVCIALGSSLRVSPANEIPKNVARKKGKLVIGNLQKTPLDSKAALTINAFCDDVMIGLMQRLEMSIPKWELVRRVKLTVSSLQKPGGNKRLRISALGLDTNKDRPYSVFRKVRFLINSSSESITKEVDKEPFVTTTVISVIDGKSDPIKISFELVFQGHYGEPELTLVENLAKESPLLEKEHCLFYDPAERKWRVNRQ